MPPKRGGKGKGTRQRVRSQPGSGDESLSEHPTGNDSDDDQGDEKPTKGLRSQTQTETLELSKTEHHIHVL